MTTAPTIIVHPEPSLLRAFGGAWRLTWRRFLVPSQLLSFGVVCAVLAIIGYSTAGRGQPHHYLEWVADFYGLFLVPLLALIAAGGAVRDDFESFNVDYVFTRPVDRAAFVVFRFLSHFGCVFALYLITAALLCALGARVGMEGMMSALPWLIVAQSLTLLTASAFGFLFGALTKRYVILGLVYTGIVEVGIGQIPTQLNQISMLRHIRPFYGQMMPGDPHLNTADAFAGAGIVLAVAVGCVAIAAVLTRFREFAGSGTRDS